MGAAPPVLVAAIIGTGTIGALAGSARLPAGRSLVAGSAGHREVARPVSTQAHAFGITGTVRRLYPGASRPLRLTVRDLEPFPIVVTSISTRVDAGGGCPAAVLTVTPFLGSLTVRAGGSRTVVVRVRLAVSAPDACQGVVFALHYTGTGRQR